MKLPFFSFFDATTRIGLLYFTRDALGNHVVDHVLHTSLLLLFFSLLLSWHCLPFSPDHQQREDEDEDDDEDDDDGEAERKKERKKKKKKKKQRNRN